MEFKKGDAVIDTSDDTIMIVAKIMTAPDGRTYVRLYCPMLNDYFTYFANDGYLKKL